MSNQSRISRYIRIYTFFFLAAALVSCSWAPRSKHYKSFYSHLKAIPYTSYTMIESPFFLVLLVNARHLDYTNSHSLLKTMVKHPSDGSLNGDVGHAWFYLQGIKDGAIVTLEGGHSGERGLEEPTYLDGVMDLVEQGDANPVRYLQYPLNDGFFQKGNGGHVPTYACKIDLDENQFNQIYRALQPDQYHYRQYSIQNHQCTTLVASLASLAGISLETKICIQIDPYVVVGNCRIQLWDDPIYAKLEIESPDMLEKSMMQAVQEGKAEDARLWYLENIAPSPTSIEWTKLPRRLKRLILF